MQVPREYVKNGEIVLNISFDATSSLKLGNDFIEFKARFAGTAREIMVPVEPRDRDLCARERAGHGVPGAGARRAARNGATRKPSPLSSVPAAGSPDEEGKVVQLVDAGNRGPEAAEDEPPRPPSGPAAGAQAGEVMPVIRGQRLAPQESRRSDPAGLAQG